MSEPTCPDPHFTFDETLQVWGSCETCGRLAWYHEQADPLQDMRNSIIMYRDGRHPREFPPAMKPLQDQPEEGQPKPIEDSAS